MAFDSKENVESYITTCSILLKILMVLRVGSPSSKFE